MSRLKKFIILLLCTVSVFALAEEAARPKIGLVLSGGGAKGFAHVGVLKVLEEYGIHPDYITGTSMGSIVGGLYAMGYSAEQLDTLIATLDWADLFMDRSSRKELAIMDKDEFERYSVSLDIQDKGLALPGGLIEGQKIGMLLQRLTAPVYEIKDFNKLPIPFHCVAVDIYTAKVHIFEEGNLGDALRSSMSIPTVFSPMEIDSMLLIDGGVSLNFPVEEVIKMGADIVIGVDVGQQKADREKKMSFIDVASQTMFMMSVLESKRQIELLDVLIVPDVEGYSTASFSNTAADSLIERGCASARLQADKLQEISEKLSVFSENQVKEPHSPDSIFVHRIRIEGKHLLSDEYIMKNLNFHEKEWVTLDQIESSISYLYGTRNFKKIDYNLEVGESGTDVILRTYDARRRTFNAGIRYDSYSNASILLNGTFRNAPPFSNSKLLVDGIIGQYLSLKFKYYAYAMFNTEITAVGTYRIRELEAKESYGNNLFRLTPYVDQIANLGLRRRFWNISFFEISAEGEYISQQDTLSNRYAVLSARSNFHLDNMDDLYYPQRGIKLDIKTQNAYVDYRAIHQIIFNVKAAFPFAPGVTLIPQIYAGSNLDYDPDFPLSRHFYLGGEGVTYYDDTFFPFIGLGYNEANGFHALVVRSDLQMELIPDLFFSMKINVGNVTDYLWELKDLSRYYFGYGFSIGTQTPIGPIDFTLAGHTRSPELTGLLRIGYDF